MTRIRIDTDQVREAGRRLIAKSTQVDEIGSELQSAIGSLDTWAWDGASRWRAEPMLDRVRPESAAVAEELDRLGRILVRVADVFEQEDATAARNLEGMKWVDFTPGANSVDSAGGRSGTSASGKGGVGLGGSVGLSTSYDLNDHKWSKGKGAGLKFKVVDGALYDAEDVTGDVKVGGKDIGDYKADLKGGIYEVGAKVGVGKDGFTAGAYGEVGVGEATAEGVIGSTAFGLAAAGTVAGPKAEGFIGIKDNTLGASIGGSLVSAEAEAGLNIAGANVGVKGGVSLGLEFGFKIGQETEVKFGPFKVGLSFGKAKGK